ncbi:MAG: hypothetical protein KDD37_01820 [Bdellovibrionales bacterium]|nr:hypothetical protein [Bdellovibrionales bacterium]
MIQLFLLTAFSLSPQFIEMDVTLTINGKKLLPIKALSEAGRTSVFKQSIDNKMVAIEFTPNVENGDELHVAFKVTENKKLLSTAEVITFDQQEASIEIGDSTGATVDLSLVPKIL